MPPVIPILVALAVGFGTGWTVNGWRGQAKWSEREAAWSAATATAVMQAREREQVLADAIAIIDAENTTERTKAHAENDRLRAAVDAGAQRLHVRATCPAADVPATTSGAGVDHGAGAELAADARPDYFALRAGLIDVERRLAACQGILRTERHAVMP